MDDQKIYIRTAAMADLERIAAVEAECFPVAEAACAEEFRRRLTHYADYFWLMFQGETLVSFVDGFVTDEKDLTDEMYANAAMHNENGAWQMIFGVNTVPGHRGRGYAGQLLRRAIRDAKSQGRKGLVLTCKEKMIPYYAGFGFSDEGISCSAHGGAVWHQMRLTFQETLVLYPCDPSARDCLEAAAGELCRFHYKDAAWSEAEYHAALGSARIILGEPMPQDLRHCRELKWMQSTSSGVNRYVESGCFPEGATLCCMTGIYGNIIAEHMLGMTLALSRRLPEYRDQQHRHQWQLLRYDKSLEGSTVLILGAGDIGTTLAAWLRPMVQRIIGLRRRAREFPACFDEMITPEQLDDYLGQADYVLCALPQTPETVGLLNGDRLGKMKADAVLVNGGRGSLIDQNALCKLLDQGRFWGVGLEVTDPEPLPAEHPLWDQPRVLITPHAAGNSFGPGSPMDRKILDFMIENVAAYVHGRPVRNAVDFAIGYRSPK